MSSELCKRLSETELACLEGIMSKLDGSMRDDLLGKIRSAVSLHQEVHVSNGSSEARKDFHIPPNLNGIPITTVDQSSELLARDNSSRKRAVPNATLGERGGQRPPAAATKETPSKRNRTEFENSSAITELSSMKRQRVSSIISSYKKAERAGDASCPLPRTVSSSEITELAPTQSIQSTTEHPDAGRSDRRETVNSNREQERSAGTRIDLKDESITSRGRRKSKKRTIDDIGGSDAKFFAHLRALREYNERHAHVIVDRQAPRLRRWCCLVRGAQAKGTLPASRKQALDGVGFEWDFATVTRFERFLNCLRHFEKAFLAEKVQRKQSSWFEKQLRLIESGKASAERRAVLEENECFQEHLRETEMLHELERSNQPPQGARILSSPAKNRFNEPEAPVRPSEESTRREYQLVIPFENQLPTINNSVQPVPLFSVSPVWTGRRWISALPSRLQT